MSRANARLSASSGRTNTLIKITICLLLYLTFISAYSQASDTPEWCISQGPFPLPKENRVRPSRTRLPFCQTYNECTCCNGSVSLGMFKLAQPWLRDETTNTECKKTLQTMMCSWCDPEIGTGLRKGICPEICSHLGEACADAFFEFSTAGVLQPCSQDSQKSVICSRLKDFDEEPCGMMGFELSERATCFAASPPPTLKSCMHRPEARPRARHSKWRMSWTSISKLMWLLAFLGLIAIYLSKKPIASHTARGRSLGSRDIHARRQKQGL